MPVRRHDNAPPFEVMNRGSRGVAENGASEQPGGNEHRPSLLERARQPMVLRLPRGYVILAAVSILGLLVLSYQVGQSRGQAEAMKRQQAQEQVQWQMRTLAAQRAAEELAANSPDPRRPGRHYLVLALYPRMEAQRLAAFLGQYEVEAAVVAGNNTNLFRVVDLQGFADGELNSPAYQQRVRRLKQLGSMWKQQHRGPTDLSDIWPDKYQGG